MIPSRPSVRFDSRVVIQIILARPRLAVSPRGEDARGRRSPQSHALTRRHCERMLCTRTACTPSYARSSLAPGSAPGALFHRAPLGQRSRIIHPSRRTLFMPGNPPPRVGPSAKSQKRLRADVRGGDSRFKRRVDEVYAEKPTLELWHDLSARLKSEDILPARWRDASVQHVTTQNVEMNALIGDKIFGTALMSELVENKLVKDVGEATRQYSQLASNAVMSKLVSEVLPHHVENNREAETHSAGTLIEAAVYMVNQMAGGPQAIKQLARWFVWHVVISGVMDGTIANPKGLIIELNGKTSSERDRTTPDHEPEFEARCIWPAENHIHETRARGRSKAAAEEGAAREMLELYGHDIYNAPSQNSKKEKTKKDLKKENAYGQLLTLGGVCSCNIISAVNEQPQFVATAELGGESCVAEASTKKQAMRLASQQLLESMGEYD